jgi:hypothetical protein
VPRRFTKEALTDAATYNVILTIEDDQERQDYIRDLRLSAKETKLGVQIVNDQIRTARMAWEIAQRQAGSKLTLFPDAPFPPLRCGQWDCTALGVSREDFTNTMMRARVYACPHPVAPTERLVNIDTGTERIRLSYCKDGRWRDLVADRADIADKGQIVRRIANRGVEVTSENARELVKYISEVVSLNPDAIPARRSIGRLGWIGRGWRSFAPYCEDTAYDGDDSFQAVYAAVTERGSYDLWVRTMRILRKNSALFRMVMAASFASPLLEPLSALPFVLHLWGGTGAGKTVAGMCAMSVWGNPGKGKLMWTLDNTHNFFGQAASFLRNLPFFADELQIVRDKYGGLDKLVMRLCEGIDRGRARAYGGTQETKQWFCAFLFTGEESVSRTSSGGGVKNRLIEVQLKDGDILVPDGNRVAALVTANYGGAGKRFIEAVRAKDMEEVSARYRALQRELMAAKDTTDKQAYSMAAMLLADELACETVFAGDAPLTVPEVLPYLTSAQEVDVAGRAYDWAVSWIARNPLRWVTPGAGNNGEMWGKIDGGTATINRDVLAEHMDKADYPYSACVSAWAERGLLLKTSQGKNVHNASVNGIKGSYLKLVLPDGENDLPF